MKFTRAGNRPTAISNMPWMREEIAIRRRVLSTLLPMILLFISGTANAAILVEDHFGAGFDESIWSVKPWNPDGSTYINGTQLRVYPYQPPVHDGVLDLVFSTYNPSAQIPGDSFYGSQIISVQQFGPTLHESVKFTCRARFVPPIGQTNVPGGIIGSEFVYELVSSNTRDEIDVEVLTKPQDEGPGILTNVFIQDPFTAAGDVEFVPVALYDFRDFHEYSFIWAVDSVTWYLDGQFVRRETENVPTTVMPLYFNTWAPLSGGFERAIDPTLQPASSPEANIDVIWQLDYARVESVPEPLPGDYNRDGTVDAADYVVWRKNDGTTEGYNTWRANFGMMAPGSGIGAAVPEPGAIAFLALAVAALLLMRRRAERSAPSLP